MIKPFIILFNTVSLFLFSFFFGDSPVTVTGNFPLTAKAGANFTADIVINKGNLGGFAKFQMEVPEGFTVKEQEVKGGNFSFENKVAKIIWTSIPGDAEFTVKLYVTTDASVSGVKTITSKFSYINNNNKEVVEMKPAEISIESSVSEPIVSNTQPPVTSTNTEPVTPEPTTPTTTPTITPSFSKTDTSYFETTTLNESKLSCQRIISKEATPNNYNVEVKIKKGEVKGFAKYQELIPEGYAITAGSTSGSSFSTSDGKAKFVWVTLPPEEEMTISYKLEKITTGSFEATLSGGEFSYLENDQSKKVKLPVEYVSGGSYATLDRTPATYTTSTDGQTEADQNTNANSGLAPKNDAGISYLVQIGAFINAIKPDVLTQKFKLREPIKSEFAQGFSKFMVGMFGEYKDARSHRENMKQKGCRSAFVVAYNGAKRITVQEALTITSQKWFQ